MKNKKFNFGLTLLMAGSLFLTNCTKNKTNEAPSPDYEMGSTQDIVKTQMIVNDIFEMAGQAGDGASGLLPYLSHPQTTLSTMQGTVTVNNTPATLIVNQLAKFYTITFANTIGKDGHVRNGVINYDYSSSANVVFTDYTRQPEFRAVVTSTGYTVDDYSVTINSMVIDNTTPLGFPSVASVSPTYVKLSWNQTANVSITNGAGTMSWNGSIDKTLLNTNNSPVPMPMASPQTFTCFSGPFSGIGTLNWAKAYSSYSGSGVVTLPNIGSCNVTMTNLTRNMNNSPEAFYASPVGMYVTPERHPFVSGIMIFKPGSKPTRDVDFGVGEVVDYNAKVTVEGVTYDVDCN